MPCSLSRMTGQTRHGYHDPVGVVEEPAVNVTDMAFRTPNKSRHAVIRYATWKNVLSILILPLLVVSCSSRPTVQVTQPLEDSADAPYSKILVVTLFDSFDARRYLEGEIVRLLTEQGTTAVASTTMMRPSTPVVPQTFIDMVDEIGADALLLTQLTALNSDATAQDASPQATYNYWPTYYWSVWSVELTEYVEPPRILIESTLVLATQVFSVAERAPVWGMESKSKFVEVQEDGLDYQIFIDEATAIVKRMKRDGLINRHTAEPSTGR